MSAPHHLPAPSTGESRSLRGARRLRVLAGVLGTFALLVGAVSLLGWLLNLPRLTDWGGTGITMLPNTSLASLLAGAALVALAIGALHGGRRTHLLGAALGGVVGLIGLLSLLEHLFSVDLWVDRILLVRSWGQVATTAPGRMGPPASASFTLLGAAMVLLGASGPARPAVRRLAFFAGMAVIGVALLSTIGYLYGADGLYAAPHLTAIAGQTSSVLLAMGFGLVTLVHATAPARQLEEDDSATLLLRWAIPLVVILPIVLGWILLAGQQAGYYDSEFRSALRTVAEVAALAAGVWLIASLIRARERVLLRAEEDVRAAVLAGERRFREILESLPAGVFLTDDAGRVAYCNPAAAALARRPPALGRDRIDEVWTLRRDDGTRISSAEVLGAAAEGLSGDEVIAERDDGVPRWCELRTMPLRGVDGAAGSISLLVDVTERKEAEAAMARLAAIVENSDDAMVAKSLDGIVTSWNRGAERIFGYTAEEAVGQHIRFIVPPDLHQEEEDVLARLRRGEKVDHFETERLTKDGRRVCASLTVSPLRNRAGRLVGASKVGRDITERKRIEAALEEHRRLLEQRVQERTRELVEAHSRLRLADRMAAVGTLAAGLAHDMNNLLLPLGMRLETLLGAKGLPPRAAEDLAAVAGLLDHLRAMANNLSLFSRDPDKEGTEGRTELTAWHGQVRSFIDASAGDSVVLGWDVPEGLPPAAIAPHRLTQAVLNLVHNARDAVLARPDRRTGGRAKGRIVIEACMASPDADLDEGMEGPPEGRLLLRVRDDGCGMSEEAVRRCREPFFTTKDRPAAPGASGGTGLGLSLAHAIVERVGGALEIESELGRGTTVTLVIPAAKPSEAAPKGHEQCACVTVQDERLRALVRQVLSSLRYSVISGAPDAGEPGPGEAKARKAEAQEATAGAPGAGDQARAALAGGTHSRGGPVNGASLWVIDCGPSTQEVRGFLRERPGRRVVALCDADDPQAPAWRAVGADLCPRQASLTRLWAALAGVSTPRS